MDIIAAIIAILTVYTFGLWLASGIASLFGAKRASASLHKAAFLPVDMIFVGATWPKRQLDRRRFVEEFDFKPWELAVAPEEHRIIGERLKRAATLLQEAFDEQTRLQSSNAPVLKTDMADAASDIEDHKKEFWSLHNLARRVTGYHHYDRCSYRDHLNMVW